ncbi:MAG: nucleotidyltransferase family protein [Thermoplasmataceae archaeon]
MKVIILAAGSGTRIRPLSYYLPKVLLPVKGKPVLDYLVENVQALDPENIYIVASENLENIERFLEKTGRDHIKVVRGLGWETGGDLSLAIEQINSDDDYVVMNGDIVTDINLKKTYDFHKSVNSYLTAAVFDMKDEEARRFGRIQLDKDGRISKFLEKSENSPDSRSIVNTGFYIFDRRLIMERSKYLVPRKFKLETELFPQLSSEGKMYGHITDLDYWWDVGTIESYLKAENYMINKKGVVAP